MISGHEPMWRSGSSPQLRVAINATSLARGGGLTVLLGYLEGWRAIDSRLEIFVFASRSDVLEAVRGRHDEVEVLSFAAGAGYARRLALQRLALGREIARSGAQVLLTTNFLVPGCPVPQVVHHQNLKHFMVPSALERLRTCRLRELARDRAARSAVRGSTVNVFVSRFLRDSAEHLTGPDSDRNHVVHNALSETLLEEADRPDTQSRERGRLVSITSSAEHKDNPTLLRVLDVLVRDHPDVDWRLRIAGTGPWQRESELAEALGIRDRVRFLGFLTEAQLGAELRRARCALFTSRLESFGNGPLEAMAFRCPVVAARTSAVPEVVGDAGILVEPGEANRFRDAVIAVDPRSNLSDELQTRGAARVKGFRWTNSARKMEGYLRMASAANEPQTRRRE